MISRALGLALLTLTLATQVLFAAEDELPFEPSPSLAPVLRCEIGTPGHLDATFSIVRFDQESSTLYTNNEGRDGAGLIRIEKSEQAETFEYSNEVDNLFRFTFSALSLSQWRTQTTDQQRSTFVLRGAIEYWTDASPELKTVSEFVCRIDPIY